MNRKQLRYTLFLKISNGDLETVRRLFEQNNLNPNMTLNNFDWTPLHTAAYKGHKELAKYLLEKGAKLQTENKSGYTPLMIAQYNGHQELIELLANANTV
eukprot:TRINITY_DN1603_c0_g1_i5.p2 TRINITY_DN1603_c0_g1~~TRINITY_DN1603_c0_g1_i5.p2  ORF type:complete len:100 (-),score=5.30 TRINITY_DN1603_c0_g1_i5:11-310(-)